MIKRRIIIAICVGLLVSLTGIAQEVSISASVDQTQITLSDQIVYQVKVSGSSQNLPYPTFPEFQDFTVISGPNVSTSIVQSPGLTEVSKIYTFVLQPKQLGQFTIPPVTAQYQGREIESQAINIQVIKESTELIPSSLSAENITFARTQNPEINRQLKGRLFLRTLVDNKEPFVGQQFTASYYIYNDRISMGNLGIVQPEPQYKDFISEILYSPRSLNYKQVNIDGKTYSLALIKKIALVPTKAGTFTFEPLKLSCNIRAETGQRRRPRSMFDDFFSDDFFFSPFDRNVISATMVASPVEISIKPLPEPKPEGFLGTVGQYALSAEVDRAEASEDELITLKLQFAGQGYVDSIITPQLEVIEGFEIYESKAKSNPVIQADALSGEKVFEFVLRPIHPGELKIPSFSYITFDPEKKAYQTLTTEEIALNIKPGKEKKPLVIAAAPSSAISGEGKVIELGEEINYIKTHGFDPQASIIPLYTRPLFMLIQLVPLLGMGIAFLVYRRRELLISDISRARRIQARGVAARKLKAAYRALIQHDADSFSSELARALRGYLADKFALSLEGLTIDTILQQLADKGVEPALQQEAKEILEQCDLMCYAGITATKDEQLQKLYQQSIHLIHQLEKKL